MKGLENELIQVIINILNNAKDALKDIEGKKIIFINTYTIKDSVQIKIKDTGKGIPTKLIDKIFEPYFTTKHQSQGTGIGLYMTSQIITKHLHGEIIVSNIKYNYKKEDFIGASFKIKIPI
jgi:signal transduction histidine kinase